MPGDILDGLPHRARRDGQDTLVLGEGGKHQLAHDLRLFGANEGEGEGGLGSHAEPGAGAASVRSVAGAFKLEEMRALLGATMMRA
ncbi:MAG: hypothetical protein IPN07_00195 [Dehalococcoidia bacterium]|nr:hypothetical protein [Dehalococcoidia bacterium]